MRRLKAVRCLKIRVGGHLESVEERRREGAGRDQAVVQGVEKRDADDPSGKIRRLDRDLAVADRLEDPVAVIEVDVMTGDQRVALAGRERIARGLLELDLDRGELGDRRAARSPDP